MDDKRRKQTPKDKRDFVTFWALYNVESFYG